MATDRVAPEELVELRNDVSSFGVVDSKDEAGPAIHAGEVIALLSEAAQYITRLEGALTEVHAEAVREPLRWDLAERMGNIEVIVDSILPGLHALTTPSRSSNEDPTGERTRLAFGEPPVGGLP